MKIGIGLPNQVRSVRPTVIPEWAATAEEAGFSTLGTVGRVAYPGVADTVALAAAAGVTSRIGLLSNVLVATVWPAAFARMARWGQGYIGASLPPEMVAGAFDTAREAWREAGREGSPRLVAIAYFALGDTDKGRENVYDYYSVGGDEVASVIAGGVRGTAQEIKEAIKAFADLGADELILNPATDDINEVMRLAEVAL